MHVHACKSGTNSEGTADLEKKAVEQEARHYSDLSRLAVAGTGTGRSIEVEGF